MSKKFEVAFFELVAVIVLAAMTGALIHACVRDYGPRALQQHVVNGVTDDAAAVRRASEHIERLLSHHAQRAGEYVP
jgi:hypothetical protein